MRDYLQGPSATSASVSTRPCLLLSAWPSSRSSTSVVTDPVGSVNTTSCSPLLWMVEPKSWCSSTPSLLVVVPALYETSLIGHWYVVFVLRCCDDVVLIFYFDLEPNWKP